MKYTKMSDDGMFSCAASALRPEIKSRLEKLAHSRFNGVQPHTVGGHTVGMYVYIAKIPFDVVPRQTVGRLKMKQLYVDLRGA